MSTPRKDTIKFSNMVYDRDTLVIQKPGKTTFSGPCGMCDAGVERSTTVIIVSGGEDETECIGDIAGACVVSIEPLCDACVGAE